MNKGRFSRYLRFVVFLGDVAVLNGLFIGLYLTGHFIVETFGQDAVSWSWFLVLLNISWLVIIFYTNPYKVSRVFNFVRISGVVIYTVFQHFLVTCTAIYLLDFELVHKWGPPAVYMIFLLFVLAWRLGFFYFLQIYRSRGYNFRSVIVVGYGAISRQMEYFFRMHPEHGYRFVGFFDDQYKHPKVLGKLSDIQTFLVENKIDEIYCCLPYIKYGAIKKIIDMGEERFLKVKLIADYRAFSFKGLELERYDHIPVLNVTSMPLDDRRNQVMKRVFDMIFSLFLTIVIFSWLFPLIALAIKLDSRGPVFFRQRRTGQANQEFTCLKFRTMHVNDEADHRQASKQDSRITRVGAFLRKTSLDELPQFMNVLSGDMSVVGPRPHMLKHTEEYSKVIGKFMARHFVKPGVTGLAQSKGYRGETKNILDMKNRVKLDRFYIENWSFLLDVKIIVLTVLELLRGSEKAY
ncbi:MAG TPA: undecaprenyl-phosphate glucose phosphotransferase [Cyclobacteriaceae bacterium]|nr:undecaprenyl-phosphate glucose phosphotransferase [Cyclobacteriaceae bacterium]